MQFQDLAVRRPSMSNCCCCCFCFSYTTTALNCIRLSDSSRNLSGDYASPENITSFHVCCIAKYYNSFNFYRNGKLPRNQIGRSGVQFKKENEALTFLCVHVLHETFNLVISSCRFTEDGQEMYQNSKCTCKAIFFAP